ncbi:putative WD40/YVTN repeat-like-containing domain superfamily [Dioscorea sansibarensis]
MLFIWCFWVNSKFGPCFSSGGEDGYVRLHHFDPDYFNIKM